ncbi:ATP-binding protein [Oceanobacter mangrovi]|uniref:ATP-binding protein n=1 Tax=Oceanobacter mangrovi TaxID=2862510 RepID=UPI001C8E5C93|nr:ATP-binding protein [Oceanobacter mangrovi]
MNRYNGGVRALGLLLSSLVALYALVSVIEYQFISRETLDIYANEQAQIVQADLELLGDELKDNRRRSLFLSQVPPMQGILRATASGGVDPYDGTALSEWKRRLQTIFYSYLQANPDVRQLRYIGLADNGRELVRVDRQNDTIRIVEQASLQEKGDRDYFLHTISLKPGQIYVSPIELNHEYGVVEYPVWPTFRVAMGVYAPAGDMFGFVIVNVDATQMFRQLQAHEITQQVFLIDQNRNFLLHPQKRFEFSYEFGNPVLWKDYFDTAMGEFGLTAQLVTDMEGQRWLMQGQRLVFNGDPAPRWLYVARAVAYDRISNQILEAFLRYQLLSFSLFVVVVFLVIALHRSAAARRLGQTMEARFQKVVSAMSEAILLVDRQGDISEMNPAAEVLFEQLVDHPLMPGQSLQQLIPFCAPQIDSGLAALGFYQDTITFDVSLHNLSGEAVFLSITLSRLDVTEKRKFNQVVVLLRDVTESEINKNILEETNHQLEVQVQQRTEQLRTALVEARQASDAKSRFLATMSHEIRTPMNGIFGMLRMLKKDPLSIRQQRHLQMAEQSVQALTRLINDILDFSKIEAGKLEIDIGEVDLVELIHNSASTMSIAAYEKDLDLICDLTAIQHVLVKTDPNRLRQIVSNLLSNAIKFTAEGRVSLRAETQLRGDDQVWFSCQVRDTGIGIAAERLQGIFDPFAQESASTSREHGGTGLGLSICRQLCELLGGHIDVVSHKGEGSTFSFALPVEAIPGSALEKIRHMDLSAVGNALVCLRSDAEAELVQRLLLRWNIPSSLCDGTPEHACEVKATLLVVDSSRLPENFGSDYASMFDYVMVLGSRHAISSDVALPGNAVLVDRPLTQINLYDFFQQLTPDLVVLKERPPRLVIQTGFLAGYTLLVVDDHSINRAVVAGLLEDSGAEIIEASDGEEAVEIFRQAQQQRPVDLILMDCHMPGLDGYEATRQIRQLENSLQLEETPVVALTAAAMSGEKEKCLACGMNDYISKPLDPARLYEVLKRYLTIRESNASAMVADEVDEQEKSMATAELWDTEGALARLNNNQQLFERVMALYLETSPENLQQISAAVEAGDLGRARSMAHKLKGASSSVGATEVTRLAQQFEQLVDGWHERQASRHCQLLQQAYDRFVIAVEQARNS